MIDMTDARHCGGFQESLDMVLILMLKILDNKRKKIMKKNLRKRGAKIH